MTRHHPTLEPTVTASGIYWVAFMAKNPSESHVFHCYVLGRASAFRRAKQLARDFNRATCIGPKGSPRMSDALPVGLISKGETQ